MMVVGNVFVELSVIIIIAVVVSAVMRALRQPLIIGYILSGILVSPYFLDLIKNAESMAAFAQMGVAVLLFMVGLNLDLKVIKEVGKVSLVTGIGQIIFTFVIGFFIAKFLGFSAIASAYISIALAFSSTIIIMKLLSDKGDISTLYGRIAIGFLIVQDIVAILILMVISSLGETSSLSSIAFQKIGLGIGLIAALVLISLFLIKPITSKMAKSQELLLLFSVGWAFAVATVFDIVGFSVEIGALLAGISLAASPYKYEIVSRMKPLRDFFLLIFFILLGSQLNFSHLEGAATPVILFSLLVFIGNPIIVMLLMKWLGYTKRSGFLAGLTVSQISEFSFILIALGVSVGHIGPEILSLITVIGLITMGSSTYAVINGNKIYGRISDKLRFFERKGRKIDEGKYHRDENYDIILFGYNRIGYSLKNSFIKLKKKFLIVDNNPETIMNLARLGIDCRYGDAEDLELLGDLPLKNAKMIISTIPEFDTNLLLLRTMKKVNRDVVFLAVSHQINDALELYKAGATYVITPHFFGGAYVASLIEKFGFRKEHFEKEGSKNTSELVKRQKEGHKDVLHERD